MWIGQNEDGSVAPTGLNFAARQQHPGLRQRTRLVLG